MIPKSGNRFSDKIMPKQENAPVSQSEAKSLFSGLEQFPALVLAVSGGPDSTALMWLAARWRKSLKAKPKLIAITVDHGLRKEAKREAAAVGKVARKLGIAHRILRWTGKKPTTGLQQAARAARYKLLAEAARKDKATHILTAHTLDDQAETVLIRMSRGSGLRGLAAMQRLSRLDGAEPVLALVRPLLEVPKARLIATLKAAKIAYADDPSNRDPRFTRARLRALMARACPRRADRPASGGARAAAPARRPRARGCCRPRRGGLHEPPVHGRHCPRRCRICAPAGRNRAAPAGQGCHGGRR